MNAENFLIEIRRIVREELAMALNSTPGKNPIKDSSRRLPEDQQRKKQQIREKLNQVREMQEGLKTKLNLTEDIDGAPVPNTDTVRAVKENLNKNYSDLIKKMEGIK